MVKILDRADGVLLEGRESVRDLRESGASAAELSELLAATGDELSQSASIVFNIAVIGDSRPLDSAVYKETYRIAREALSNAFQHSQATKIEVELTYNNAGISVRVRDNGSGIDNAILGSGRAGHWGLSGMRERARKVGGQLNIWSKAGAGTEIELTIPAAVAYPRSQGVSLWHRIKRAMSGAEGINRD